MRSALFVLLLLVVAAPGQKPPVSIDDLMKVRNVLDVRIAPDGNTVCYVATTPEPEEKRHTPHLYLVPTSGVPSRKLKLTNGRKGDDKPRWSPDGKTIAFVSDRDGSPQVWLISPTGGEARKLSNLDGKISDIEWAPDGMSLAAMVTDADTEEEKKRKKEKGDYVLVEKEDKSDHLHIIDAKTGKARQLTRGGTSVVGLSWSPDSREIAIAVRKSPRLDDFFDVDLAIVDAASGKSRDLVKRPGLDTLPRWSPDGKNIAFISNGGKYGWAENHGLWVIDAKGGTPRAVAGRFDEKVGGRDATDLQWIDGERLYFVADSGLSRRFFRVRLSEELAEVVGPDGHVVDRLSLARDGKRLAFVIDSPNRPSEVFTTVIDAKDNEKQLTNLNPHLQERAFGKAERFAWKGKEGLALDALLILPVGYEKGKRYPLLTYVHGGPAGKHSYGFEPQITTRVVTQGGPYAVHVLAGKGFAVFCPNVRGSGGYGEKFRKLNVRDWGGGDLDDIHTGIDALIKAGIADPDRLGIMGWSYGGVMTGHAVTKSKRFKAASAGAGVHNLTSFYGTTDIPRFMESYFKATPWSDPAVYVRHSSIHLADRITTPTLIQHGDKDLRVPLSQSEELHRALTRHGVPTEFVVYPRQGHLIMEPKLQADMMRRNVEWFERWLKPKGEK